MLQRNSCKHYCPTVPLSLKCNMWCRWHTGGTRPTTQSGSASQHSSGSCWERPSGALARTGENSQRWCLQSSTWLVGKRAQYATVLYGETMFREGPALAAHAQLWQSAWLRCCHKVAGGLRVMCLLLVARSVACNYSWVLTSEDPPLTRSRKRAVLLAAARQYTCRCIPGLLLHNSCRH